MKKTMTIDTDNDFFLCQQDHKSTINYQLLTKNSSLSLSKVIVNC